MYIEVSAKIIVNQLVNDERPNRLTWKFLELNSNCFDFLSLPLHWRRLTPDRMSVKVISQPITELDTVGELRKSSVLSNDK